MLTTKHIGRNKLAVAAVNLAVLSVVAGGTTAYAALSKSVTIDLDGDVQTVRTFGDTVGAVLAARDVELAPGDTIDTPTTSALSDGDHVTVRFAKPISVVVDGKSSERTLLATNVGEALDAFGVKPSEDAYVSGSRATDLPRTGTQIVVSNPKKVTLIADGEKEKLTTTAPTVEALLAENKVKLDADDEVSKDPEAFLTADQKVKVVRIEVIEKVEHVDTDAPIVYRDSAELEKGTTKVLEAGDEGSARESVRLIMADGKLRKRIVLASTPVSRGDARVVLRGTAAAPAVPSDSVWDRIAQCESGGNWSINTGNGYYGGLQFSAATWRSVGGPGLPHQHSREVQIKYAKILQARAGWGQWSCARHLGL